MRQIAIIVITVFIFSMANWGQAYYEASGQTAVFTLMAGAKAGPSSVVKNVSMVKTASVFRLVYDGNRLTISGGFTGELKLYRLNGKQIGTWGVDESGIVGLNRSLASEVYLARFEEKGGTVKTVRLAVIAEGGR